MQCANTMVKMQQRKKNYTELISLPTFIDRFNYLKLDGKVGEETFGAERYLNQILYRSNAWKTVRKDVLIRDCGCDLGCSDRVLGRGERVYVHHINPITVEMVLNRDLELFDSENLITCSHFTHLAIHYGDESLLIEDPIIRKPNDMIPWRQ